MRIVGLALLVLMVAPARTCWASGSEAVPPLPMAAAETNSILYRWLRKPVHASRILSNAETTNGWSHHGAGALAPATERAYEGSGSMRLTSPTKTDAPPRVVGRPFGEAVARLDIGGEDWRPFNRLSFWVYPDLPGFRAISFLVKVHNDGEKKVPDGYGREGLHYVLLRHGTWNHVVWEIPHLGRDRVTAVDFIYRLQGHEPGATDRVAFHLDRVALERVDADHFEGWDVAPGRVAYSHTGYEPSAAKVAVASGLVAREFSVLDAGTGRRAFRGRVTTEHTPCGAFQVLDFGALEKPGRYRLQAGGLTTPDFPIATNLWRETVWKTINLFYCERCGERIPGIHDVCHSDWRAQHAGAALVINGGWHDAGDLSQGLVNTAEAICAMLELGEQWRAAEPTLAQRLIDEARWGLAWLHKTRFPDGTRVTWATMDYWTDGVLGTVDDTLGQTGRNPLDLFLAAAAEARAARVFRGIDPAFAATNLVLARADWAIAMASMRSSRALEPAAAGALAASELHETLSLMEPGAPPGEESARYRNAAREFAATVVDCQQQSWTDWEQPAVGFLYSSTAKNRILHYGHRGHEQMPVVALTRLCAAFPEDAHWADWYAFVVLHSEYLRWMSAATAPFNLLPASIYTSDESTDPRFIAQVRQGVPLSERHYLRRFPVWFDFRGNHGTVLSQTKALAVAAHLRNERSLLGLVRNQLEWVVGRNPFAQSTMYGEGHDFAPQYTAMSGDMVGSLPVGIQTREELDVPYWPAANCYNYKEVWVHPSSRWLSIIADITDASLRNEDPAPRIAATVHADTSGPIVRIRADLTGTGAHQLVLRGKNLRCAQAAFPVSLRRGTTERVLWTAEVIDPGQPWVGVIVPDGLARAGWEVLDPRLQTWASKGVGARRPR